MDNFQFLLYFNLSDIRYFEKPTSEVSLPLAVVMSNHWCCFPLKNHSFSLLIVFCHPFMMCYSTTIRSQICVNFVHPHPYPRSDHHLPADVPGVADQSHLNLLLRSRSIHLLICHLHLAEKNLKHDESEMKSIFSISLFPPSPFYTSVNDDV